VSDSIAIADAVVASLAGGEFSRPFTPKRAYLPEFGLQELEGLHVTAIPRSLPQEQRLDRSGVVHTHEVDVAVQQRVSLSKPAEIDALMDLLEAIHDHLRDQAVTFGEDGRAEYTGATREPLYSAAHLREFQCFTGVITISYEVTR